MVSTKLLYSVQSGTKTEAQLDDEGMDVSAVPSLESLPSEDLATFCWGGGQRQSLRAEVEVRAICTCKY